MCDRIFAVVRLDFLEQLVVRSPLEHAVDLCVHLRVDPTDVTHFCKEPNCTDNLKSDRIERRVSWNDIFVYDLITESNLLCNSTPKVEFAPRSKTPHIESYSNEFCKSCCATRVICPQSHFVRQLTSRMNLTVTPTAENQTVIGIESERLVYFPWNDVMRRNSVFVGLHETVLTNATIAIVDCLGPPSRSGRLISRIEYETFFDE